MPDHTELQVAMYRTPFGDGWIAYDSTGPIEFGPPRSQPPVISGSARAPRSIRHLAARLERYWAGEALPSADSALIRRAGGTPLLRRIYEVVASIPAGSTMTYGEVAAAAGRPDAPRAVGTAMARNPFAPVIPCHRVVGSDGSLRGYGGGLDMKAALLAMEAADA